MLSLIHIYENRFSEILALVAYTGAGGSRQAFTTSPELTTGGMLPKACLLYTSPAFYQDAFLHIQTKGAFPPVCHPPESNRSRLLGGSTAGTSPEKPDHSYKCGWITVLPLKQR